MIEVTIYYDLLPGIDIEEYKKWAKYVIETNLKARGIIEFKAFRNAGGSPQVCSTTVWKTLGDWGKYAESKEFQEIDAVLRDKYATNVNMTIWRPSPIVPRAKRPKRKKGK